MVKKPLTQSNINDGDLSNDRSNMVARVRRTDSGQIWQPGSSSYTSRNDIDLIIKLLLFGLIIESYLINVILIGQPRHRHMIAK